MTNGSETGLRLNMHFGRKEPTMHIARTRRSILHRYARTCWSKSLSSFLMLYYIYTYPFQFKLNLSFNLNLVRYGGSPTWSMDGEVNNGVLILL